MSKTLLSAKQVQKASSLIAERAHVFDAHDHMLNASRYSLSVESPKLMRLRTTCSGVITPEIRALFLRDLAMRIAEIEEELTALGVEIPNIFERVS